jgi:prepilin-type N-terminal cleavage/methylation domain-containing protein
MTMTRAFTLIELMVVIAIIAIIAAIAIPNLIDQRDKAKAADVANPPRMTAEYIEGVGTIYTDTKTGRQYFRARERDTLVELAPVPAEAK